MTYSLHPGAELDIASALDFYSEQAGPWLLSDFSKNLNESQNSWLNIPDSERQRQVGVEHSR